MLFDAPDFDAHEGVHWFADRATGLRAIIAVHSTHLGPAAGGCRFWDYASDGAALTDALRLSRGMSYKNAMAGLPLGGGKAVILKREHKDAALLEAFGSAIESLSGKYVTAEDVGMTDHDMTVIARKTRHVSGLPVSPAAAGGNPGTAAAGGNPGPSTAEGVFLGIRAAIRHKLGRDNFNGVHVAIQGLGSVGMALAERLHAAGAKLTVADIHPDRTARAARDLGADVAGIRAILATKADVLSPCALGAVLDETSIAALNVPIVAGAANNQLATPADGARVQARGILYAPDYVINAGGIINVAAEYLGAGDAASVTAAIARIEPRLADIFATADADGRSTDVVADAMARALIGR